MISLRNCIKALVPFLFGVSILHAQTKRPAIEGWRVHSNFNNNNDLCQTGHKIYVASQVALFTIDLRTNESEVISRATGLSDVKSTHIASDPQTNTTVVVFDNCNIDLIKGDAITNIPLIKNQLIIGKKVINNIAFNGSVAYLSCSFGVVLIDLVKQKLIDSWTNLGPGGTNIEITDVAVFNGYVYLASENGIYRARAEGDNLSDYHSWQLLTTSTWSSHLEVFSGKLYGVIDSTLKTFNGTTWDIVAGQTPITINSLRAVNNKLIVGTRVSSLVIRTDHSITSVNFHSDAGVIIATDSNLYAPVNPYFVIRYHTTSGEMEYFGPVGPQGNTAIRMASSGRNLWVAGGGVLGYGSSSGWNSPMYLGNKFYRFNNNTWYNYNTYNNKVINTPGDFVDVAIHPETGNALLANFGAGIIEVADNVIVNTYDTTNSSLQNYNTPNPTYRPLMVSGLAFDNDHRLWVSNYGAINPISVLSEGQWHNFPIPSGVDNLLTSMVCDDYGNKWIICTRSLGIFVFNENGSIANTNDDMAKVLNESKGNGLLPSNTVFCMAKDQNGAIWTGTSKGLCIFNNPENVFRTGEDFDAQQLVIKTGLIYSNFLGDVPVYSITVDAGNRKWIGTEQGVWLVSPDGYTVLKNFTTANSPLLSNLVYSIGIDQSTGEVFFGTEKGICSYMGSSSASNSEQDNVFIFPNPVKKDFTGLIAIQGLTENAYVKITDISGNLVYETRANGGMATWNGITFRNVRAPSGVYIIYSSNEDGTTSWAGKFIIEK